MHLLPCLRGDLAGRPDSLHAVLGTIHVLRLDGVYDVPQGTAHS